MLSSPSLFPSSSSSSLSNPSNKFNSANIKDKISVPPLSTERLLPTRHKTRNAIMSILASGEVVIEFIKVKSRYKEERITDICRISKDGQCIIIHEADPLKYV